MLGTSTERFKAQKKKTCRGNQATAPRKKLFFGVEVDFTLGGNAADALVT